jgi:hypothetical protein
VKKARVVLLGVAAAGVVAGLFWGGPYAYYTIATYPHVLRAARREPAAEQAWKTEFGSIIETRAASPKGEDNESALRLIALASAAGIDLARPKGTERIDFEHDPDRAMREAAGDYVTAEVTKVGGPVEPPPKVAREYLEAHEPALDALVEFLSNAEPLAWKCDSELGPDAPVPNLLGLIRLQRLLVARALTRASAGEPQEAERTLSAAWFLNASIRDRPEVVCQIIAIAAARLQVGLARRLALDPAAWRERLNDHDYRASVLRALVLQNDRFFRRLPAGPSARDRATRADLFDLTREFLVALRDAPVGDGSIPISAPAKTDSPASEGEILASIWIPNLADTMRRAVRLAIDTELTDRVLQARSLRHQLGHWPTGMPEIDGTRVPGARWIYTLDERGRPSISFSRDLHWESLSGLCLPLRYEPA